MKESDLYGPVKDFLEEQGYEVKGEIGKCDVVAFRGADPPIIVELKTGFTIGLLLQGVDRLSLTDSVYLAVPRGKTKTWRKTLRDVRKLCRRLGLGLMTVTGQAVEVHLDPGPMPSQEREEPRKAARGVQGAQR